MDINGENFTIKDIFDTPATVPDCIVINKNKLGTGHGEAKFYITSKEKMRGFYGGEGFNAKCFILKKDLVDYMNAMRSEYFHPTQNYKGKEELAKLWKTRMGKVRQLDEVVEFNMQNQVQIEGARGYVNSSDDGHNLIRELSLPLVSYVSAMKLADKNGTSVFYWKLFADFDAISEKSNALVFCYGKKEALKEERKSRKGKEVNQARIGQGFYREKLLGECPFCPITMINDERLLVANHIVDVLFNRIKGFMEALCLIN